MSTYTKDDPDWAPFEVDARSPRDLRRAFRRGVLTGCGCSLGGLLVMAATSFMVFGLLTVTGHIPDSAAMPGDELHESTLSMLREEGVLGEDEEILYYYSDGVFSFREDGNFFTDRRVVSYWLADDDIVMEDVAYPEIADITAAFDDTLFANSKILVEQVDGDSFYLAVSNESDLDEEFVELLIATWVENR